MKAPVLQAALDRAGAEAQADQLLARHHAMLARGALGQTLFTVTTYLVA